jgi:hypothetical protein
MIIFRIPGPDEYSYVETHEEKELSPKEIRARFDELTEEMALRSGVTQETWNKMVDDYLKTKSIPEGGDHYELLNSWQKWFLNEIKKSYKRTG